MVDRLNMDRDDNGEISAARLEAVLIFQKLARDPALGYYSVLSYYRLMKLPGAPIPAGLEVRLGLKKADTPAQSALPRLRPTKN